MPAYFCIALTEALFCFSNKAKKLYYAYTFNVGLVKERNWWIPLISVSLSTMLQSFGKSIHQVVSLLWSSKFHQASRFCTKSVCVGAFNMLMGSFRPRFYMVLEQCYSKAVLFRKKSTTAADCGYWMSCLWTYFTKMLNLIITLSCLCFSASLPVSSAKAWGSKKEESKMGKSVCSPPRKIRNKLRRLMRNLNQTICISLYLKQT